MVRDFSANITSEKLQFCIIISYQFCYYCSPSHQPKKYQKSISWDNIFSFYILLQYFLLDQIFKSHHSQQMEDEQSQQSHITLIYHNFRGMAQKIRYILFYLDIPFTQLLIKNGEDPLSLEIIKKCNFEGELELPCIVHKQRVIQDCFAIIRHLCTLVKREDLLGNTIEERTLIRQIYYNYMLNKKKSIMMLFRFGQEALKCLAKKQQIRKQAMLYSHKQSGSIIPLATMKLRHPTQRYIFDHITILDFLFFEQSFYQINLFGNLQEKNCKILQTINSIFGTELSNIKDKSTLYLRVMREFVNNFEKEQFYVQNKERLEAYTVLSPSMGTNCKEAFRGVWLGDWKFVQ